MALGGPVTAASQSLPAIEEIVVATPEPRYVAPTTRDRIGRIWAPVLINGRGPYRLVLDTGATQPAVTQRVVDELGLPVRSVKVKLLGATGSAVVSAVDVDTLEFGDLQVERLRLPIVPDAFGGADGVLGGDALKDKRIVIEFQDDRITIVRSKHKPAPSGYSVVPFSLDARGGLRIRAKVGPVDVTALIDTGAQNTVGNLALRQALIGQRNHPDDGETAVVGVTEHVQQAARVRVPDIVVGRVVVHNAEIMFSDLRIFEHWGLQSKPALLIGMDVLGQLDTLVVDYGRRELQVRMRP